MDRDIRSYAPGLPKTKGVPDTLNPPDTPDIPGTPGLLSKIFFSWSIMQ